MLIEGPIVFSSTKADDILGMTEYDRENMHKKAMSHSIRAFCGTFSIVLHGTDQEEQHHRHLPHHQDEETKPKHQIVHGDHYIVSLFISDTWKMFFGVNRNGSFWVSA